MLLLRPGPRDALCLSRCCRLERGALRMMAMTQHSKVLEPVVSRVTDVVDLKPLDAAAHDAEAIPSTGPVPS